MHIKIKKRLLTLMLIAFTSPVIASGTEASSSFMTSEPLYLSLFGLVLLTLGLLKARASDRS